MKIKLSKNQWELIGKKTGWMKTSSSTKNIKASQTDPTTKIITDHILQKQKMLHAIDLAIPCLQDWTRTTERGEIWERDMKALNALEDAIKDVEHLRGHGFKWHQDQDGWV